MSLVITLDKSTFQGLSHKDLIQLHRYYIVNVTPLLVCEILGDLSKEEIKGKNLPKDIVVGLANKIFPSNTYVNMHFKKMLELSLTELNLELSNRPYLEASKSINSSYKKGLVFEETEQEISIRRWKQGQIDTIDELNSLFWRTESKSETVIEDFKKKFDFFSKIKLKNKTGNNFENLKQLRDLLFVELDKVENQNFFLALIIDYFEIDYGIASNIFHRWESENHNSIKKFSEYAYFCLSIITMYFVAINNNLFSERKTNLLDLEYLFYTPCSMVFSSNDKFLVNLFRLIEPENVFFISATALKGDLNKFHKFEEENNIISERPPDKDSETYKIWDKVFDLKLSDFLNATRTEKDHERAKAEFEKIIQLAEDGEQGSFEGNPDFVAKSYNMLPTDPCICGSGKQLKDCCLKN